jgi:transglutaminase-like putative cysteine protease
MSAMRLLAFAALAAFAAGHWATLVASPPATRLALAVAAIVAGAAILEVIARVTSRLRGERARRAATGLLAAAVGIAATAVALIAIGIAPRLLWPTGWEELGPGIDLGLAGLAGSVSYPYAGDEQWSRLAILAVAPLALGLAATLAFWPGARSLRRPPRLAGLVALIALYAGAVATNPPPGALPRGLLLLALVAAWLWLPAIRRRDVAAATAMVVAAGALAIPAAAQLDAADPWLDYRTWKVRSAAGSTYQWDHSYGPIDWPRDGTQMLAVQSDEAHYWKTAVLDRFDGRRWKRSHESAAGGRDLPEAVAAASLPAYLDRRWVKRFRVIVGELESEAVVGAGTPIRIQGVGAVLAAPDGTAVVRGDPLRRGDAYSMTAYVPDPTAESMRATPEGYPPELERYTRIEVPRRSSDGTVATTADSVSFTSRGTDGDAAIQLARTPYRRTYELTRSLVDAQPTTYDAVRAIQDHLRNRYGYSELPPRRRHPLPAFLFRDRIGYCQQFSGAMALMLRMAGIPSRVVGGFAPGTPEGEGRVFRVEDLDAHSWVEAYFQGIGWVAFDPTPSAAPASSQQVPGLPTADVAQSRTGPEAGPGALASGGIDASEGPGRSSDSAVPQAVVAGLLGGLVLAGAVVRWRTRRYRRLAPAIAAELQLAELGGALERFGWPTADGATLLGLAGRLRRSRRPAASRYVDRLRTVRYGPHGGPPPSLTARRALRRELGSSRGLGGRLRALVAIPPGGPRQPKRRLATSHSPPLHCGPATTNRATGAGLG